MTPRKAAGMAENQDLISDCKARLNEILDTLNGNGHDGIKTRIARIQENLESTSELTRQNAVDMQGLLIATSRLEMSVEAHQKSQHLSDMLKKKSFYAVLIGAYIGLHIVATYIPSGLDWLMTLLGLPHLILPLQ